MKEFLIHYGVPGMKWGVRKQYEGTGRSGGGGWGPNNSIATGGGPSPLAASMAGNPKKKSLFGKKEVQKMGVQDKAKKEAEIRKYKAEKEANELSKAIALGTAYEDMLNTVSSAGGDITPDMLKEYNRLTNDYLAKSKAMEKDYGFISSDIVTDNGKDYVYTMMMNKDFTEIYEGMAEIDYNFKFEEKK